MLLYRQLELHQDSLLENIKDKVREEKDTIEENLEVQVYEQSIKGATLSEESDKILAFLEEFIKKYSGQKSAKDVLLYRELQESDKENINDVLKSFGIVYTDAF